MIELGMRVVDKVTGFNGIAVSRVEYLNGCVQYVVKPPVGTEFPEGIHIDQARLVVVGNSVSIGKKKTGGEMNETPSVNYRS